MLFTGWESNEEKAELHLRTAGKYASVVQKYY